MRRLLVSLHPQKTNVVTTIVLPFVLRQMLEEEAHPMVDAAELGAEHGLHLTS